jgi:hypothetical protein
MMFYDILSCVNPRRVQSALTWDPKILLQWIFRELSNVVKEIFLMFRHENMAAAEISVWYMGL